MRYPLITIIITNEMRYPIIIVIIIITITNEVTHIGRNGSMGGPGKIE